MMRLVFNKTLGNYIVRKGTARFLRSLVVGDTETNRLLIYS